MSNEKVMTNHLIVGLIKKALLNKMNFFFPEPISCNKKYKSAIRFV